MKYAVFNAQGFFAETPKASELPKELVEFWCFIFEKDAEDFESHNSARVDKEVWIERLYLVRSAFSALAGNVILYFEDSFKFLANVQQQVSVAYYLGPYGNKDREILEKLEEMGIAEKFYSDNKESVRLANEYHKLEVFKASAGRDIVNATAYGDGTSPDFDKALEDFKKKYENIAVKVNKPKYMNVVFFGKAFAEAKAESEEMLGWAAVHLEGIPEMFMIQEFKKMNLEYRFFVKNNKIIAGAGCVPELTPVWNEGHRFDNKVVDKGFCLDSRKIINRPDYVEKATEFAEKVVENLKLECKELKNYILDVYYSGEVDGSIDSSKLGVVEINPIQNFGVFSANTDFLVRGLLDV